MLDLNVKNNTFNTVGIGVRWAAQGGTEINAAVRDNTMTAVSNDAVRGLADPSDPSFGASTDVDAIVEGNNFGGGSVFIASRRGATTDILLGGGEAAGQTGNTNIGGFGIALEANRAGILNIDVLNNTVNANVPEPGTINAALYVQSANSGGGSSTITAKISGNSFQADANDDPIADVVCRQSQQRDPAGRIRRRRSERVHHRQQHVPCRRRDRRRVQRGGHRLRRRRRADRRPVLGFLMAGSGGVGDSGTTASPETTPDTPQTTPDTTPPNPADTGVTPPAQPAPGIVETHLTQTELDAIVSAALARWEATGLTAEQSAYLQNVTFNVADMSGLYLGAANPGLVTIDSDGAGYGWYVDANAGRRRRVRQWRRHAPD